MDVSEQHLQPLATHWSWRPDWTPDRRCWWWYATFEHELAVQRLAGQTCAAFAPGAPVDPIPSRWLHLSLLELGYAEAVPRAGAYELGRRVHRSLGRAAPLEVVVGPVSTMPGAVVLPVSGPRLPEVQQALTAASAEVLGDVPVQEPFLPHVSVAYVNADCAVDRVLDPDVVPLHRTVRTRIDRLALVEVVRSRRHYRWTGRCLVTLGGRRARSGKAHSR